MTENCFYANNKTFCKKPKIENDCDSEYLMQSSKVFKAKCFTRLPFKNIITQIKNDIYFLVMDSLSIDVICNDTQTIHMFESSKILNNKCYINTTNFMFNQNSSFDYGMVFENLTESEEKFYKMIDFKITMQIFMLFMNLIIYFYYKINFRINAQNNAINDASNLVKYFGLNQPFF